jgi:hypothetical protein
VVPFFEDHDVKLLRILTDRGNEFCGNTERREYELYLAVEDIDHSRAKTKSPQTNGICERFRKTVLKEFYVSPSARRCIVQSTSYRPTWPHQAAASPGPLVLRQNADADLPGCNADNKGDDRGLITSDTKTRSLNSHQLDIRGSVPDTLQFTVDCRNLTTSSTKPC